MKNTASEQCDKHSLLTKSAALSSFLHQSSFRGAGFQLEKRFNISVLANVSDISSISTSHVLVILLSVD